MKNNFSDKEKIIECCNMEYFKKICKKLHNEFNKENKATKRLRWKCNFFALAGRFAPVSAVVM